MQDGKFALVTKGFSYISGSGSETDIKTCLTTEGKNQNCYPTAHPFGSFSCRMGTTIPTVFIRFTVLGAYLIFGLWEWALIRAGRLFEAGHLLNFHHFQQV